MLKWRLSDEPVDENESEEFKDPEKRKNTRCSIFLGYTSNQVSSGNREVIRYLCQNKMVDLIVTTCGAIEEDIIKCMADTYVGEFSIPGVELRRKGINRTGNLLIANENYGFFEDWLTPILDHMLDKQKTQNKICSPAKLIKAMGKKIADERSVLYWCWKNKIPIMCPGITDGSVGDMIYLHGFKNPGLIVDVAQDIKTMISTVTWAKKNGMIILGGGIVKHHICNAHLFKSGADFSVFINTGQEFDGSDSGARPDEAVSWGKIKHTATPVKVYCEATIAFPILVAQTFASDNWEPKP